MFFGRHVGRRLDADFEEFVTARSAGLLRLAFLLVNDRGHAEDLLQTALLRTAMRWHRVREQPDAYVPPPCCRRWAGATPGASRPGVPS
ncbi:SigE family RNA polymerase sigma factor [Streptoalloteichus hindustanus]|uniref:hypothetical protein n=1 Tax=Streptoalloteichus hindustanus TaxID=2017 RepID=UPI0009363425|nr:hypothetical protein [Streptoalloteichus hindustanus]